MNSVKAAEALLICKILLLVSAFATDVLHGTRNSTTKVRISVYERICQMKDRSVIYWLVGIFLFTLIAALYLQGNNNGCVGDGGGQYSYEVCE